MSTIPRPVEANASPALEAARQAERDLWQHYGLEMTESYVVLGTPALRVRSLECGNPRGTPIVFVAGGLGEALGWSSLLARLGDFRCIALDRPGGGLSDGVDFMEVDVRRLAADVLEAVLDAHGLQHACFVANSMGGWWTFQLALRQPKRVTGMIMLGCPAVILDTSAPLPMRLISLPVLGGVLVNVMAPSSPTKARDLPGFLGHPPEVGHGWSESEAEATYRFGNLPDAPRSWTTLLRRFLRLTGSNKRMRITEDELKRITQPTLFVWGKSDPFGSVEAGRRAAALVSNARLEVVGRGHVPWWDEPQKCADLIRNFVGLAP